MGMLGNQLAPGTQFAVTNDSYNGDGSTTAFTLSQSVSAATDIEVIVDNVQQSPYDSSYSVSGTALTFSEAPAAGTNNIYVIYHGSKHHTTAQVIPDDGAVTPAKLHTDVLGPMTVDAVNNNIGIGTSSPGKPLHVEGGADYNMIVRSASNRSGLAIHHPGTGALSSPLGSALVLESDDTFRLGTQTHYNIIMDQSGYVTLPRLPVCYGRLSGTGAQTSGYLSPLSIDYDPLGMVSTANSRITVPVTGRYCILAAQLVDPVPTYTYLNLRVNQTTVFHDHNNMMASGDNMTHKVSVVRSLSANDYIDFTYSGDIATLWAGNHSYYSVHLLG